MGLTYLHHFAVERPAAGGSTDPTTGNFVPGGVATVAYDDAADVQDGEVAIAFAEDGTPTKHAQARIFLKDEVKILDLQIGDTGTVTGERYGAGQDCEIVGLRVIDGVVFVDWLRGA